ncbi:putative phage tail protein [Paraburkholderia azotifigens]|uniref:YmfQ family protein n=1 Tax=Paraburkholderia azotifigens TaxID=2057004 RepID=UPI003172CE3F
MSARRVWLAQGIVPARNPAGDYADVLRKLLPRGRVWTREDEGTQAAVLDALALTAESIDSSALTLIAAAFPATADQLLPEWDATLGLPDACFGPFTSDDENRQQIVAKLIGAGGQSIAYFEALAYSLGYEIQITEYAIHTVIRPVTAPIAGTDWPYTWKVSIGDALESHRYTVNDAVDTPLSLRKPSSVMHWHTVDDPVEDALSSPVTQSVQQLLECLLKRYAPAQTVVVFEYA